jgi:hypothetical protein
VEQEQLTKVLLGRVLTTQAITHVEAVAVVVQELLRFKTLAHLMVVQVLLRLSMVSL